MSFRFRDVAIDDLDAILALNRMAGISVAAIDRTTLLDYYENAVYFRIAETEGGIAGFLIGTDHTAQIGNPGFDWFRARHAEFAYIDRIVIASDYRGHGLGRVFYADMTSFAEVRVPVLGCQVSLSPRDDVSLLFHASLGFHEVAQLARDEHRIGVMERALCSYPFVREHYLERDDGALPALPWLTERVPPAPASPAYRVGCG